METVLTELKIRLDEGSGDAGSILEKANAAFSSSVSVMFIAESTRNLRTGIVGSPSELPEALGDWTRYFQSLILFDKKAEIRAEPGEGGVFDYRVLVEGEGDTCVSLVRTGKFLLANAKQAKPLTGNSGGEAFNALVAREYFAKEKSMDGAAPSGMLVRIATRLCGLGRISISN